MAVSAETVLFLRWANHLSDTLTPPWPVRCPWNCQSRAPRANKMTYMGTHCSMRFIASLQTRRCSSPKRDIVPHFLPALQHHAALNSGDALQLVLV